MHCHILEKPGHRTRRLELATQSTYQANSYRPVVIDGGQKKDLKRLRRSTNCARQQGRSTGDCVTLGRACKKQRSGWRINQLAGAAIVTEPTGNTAPQLGRGRYLMGDLFTQEADQGTGQGHD